jgi:DNA-binding beta-propeller fold protein YncE
MNDMKRYRGTRRLHLGLLLTGAVLAAMASGCSKTTDTNTGGASTDPNEAINIAPAANDKATFKSPFDAVPNSKGTRIYFVAVSVTEGPAVFAANADGSGLTKLASGAPFVSPFSISISDDDQTLYIADTATETDTQDGGAILTMSVNGGAVAPLTGSQGTRPRAVEVLGDSIYFSGTSGKLPKVQPAVFKMGLAGGAPTALVTGAPLKDPSGIAVSKSGDVYVLDTAAAQTRRASVLLIKDGAATEFKSDIPVGFPGGIALSLDDSTLFVSALDEVTARDVVYVVNLASKETSTFTKSIDKFTSSAGLHRARTSGVFAWADGTANKGTVFVLH